jgi:hypothetical protein
MTKQQSFTKRVALAIAVSAILPAASSALADTVTTTVEHSGPHHFVYYRDHDIYYAPDTRIYYWQEDGRWQSGPELPADSRQFVRVNGVNISLDTDRPYERNDYVVSHYRDAPESSTTTERTVSDNGQQTTTTTTTTTKRHYVYYGDHDIYFSPDTKTYFWMSDGRWHSGDALPMNMAPYVQTRGTNIELDTDRPYERNDYVIEHYRHQPNNDQQ